MEEPKIEEPTVETAKPEDPEEELTPREVLLKFADNTPGREGTPGELARVHIFEKPSKEELSDFCESVQRKAIESLKNTPKKSVMRLPKKFPMFDYNGELQVYEYFILSNKQSPVIHVPKKKNAYKGVSKRRKKKVTKSKGGDDVNKVAPTRKTPMKAKEKKTTPQITRTMSTRSRAFTSTPIEEDILVASKINDDSTQKDHEEIAEISNELQ